jgi:hypothetical protein
MRCSPGSRVSGRNPVDHRTLRRRDSHPNLAAGKLLKHQADVILKTSVVPAAAEQRLPCRAADRNFRRAVLHQIALRHGEEDPEVRMREGPALDDALCGIIVDVHALKLVEELVAVAHPHVEPAGRPSLRDGALDAVLAQRVSAGPFRRLAAVAPLNTRFQGGGASDRRQHSGSARRIVPRRNQVSQAQSVGLIFLIAREAESAHLRGLHRAARQHVAEHIAADHASQHGPRTPRMCSAANRTGGPGRGFRRRGRPRGQARRPTADSSSIRAISWRVM